ncbi:Lsr2 family protein [Demequina sp. NBRC 110057]|uniref:histone-like nucleoid-structuring protein Lsr2 n=1 Tax=Demequina sp. NBRC 110057 TaxID=1570346 RepID=UPI000A027019|nr:Lsr2 family protein [Demequina sp. NBRC 110057]
MAQRVKVVLVDDIDGGEASETVSFSLDGVSYEVDLSGDHAKEMRSAFEPWTSVARKVSARRGTAARAGSPRKAGDTAKIRAWAKDNGFDISERGRISTEIRDAYAAAN